MIERSRVRNPAEAAGKFSSPRSNSVLILILVSIPSPCYSSSIITNPVTYSVYMTEHCKKGHNNKQLNHARKVLYDMNAYISFNLRNLCFTEIVKKCFRITVLTLTDDRLFHCVAQSLA